MSRRRRQASPPVKPVETKTEPLPAPLTGKQLTLLLAGLLALLLLTYSNHFFNSFHFDDSHTVVNNPWIRDLHNVPRFFADAATFSTYPSDQTYRPLVSASLALDYWFGHGLNPLFFHLSTFFWYIVQLGLMFVLFRKTFDLAHPDPRNALIAFFATGVYAVHPAMAETVNYIMQRGDLYSTLGVIAGLVAYIAAPKLRRYGLYLAPVVLGMFSKEPTAVFPALLFVWIWLFEEEDPKKVFVRCLPSILVTGSLALFVLSMGKQNYNPTAIPGWNYRISQPAVLLTYFRKFFIPVGYSADSDRVPYASPFEEDALDGFIFLLAIIAAAFWCRRRRETRPIAFGLAWFLIAALPTSWPVLADVENDHRMFFPFVGLALAASWAAALWLFRRSVPRAVWASACVLVPAALAWGAHERNKVWHSDESLWYDVTVKSPRNGRGLMNYGLSQMELGRYDVALDYFERAAVFNPAYSYLETNLGIANGALTKDAEADRHFARAVGLTPAEAAPRFFYARWLNQKGRVPEAIANLKIAVANNPSYVDAAHLLMQIYADQGDRANLKALAQATASRFPSDPETRSWLARADTLALRPTAETAAESLLSTSLAFYQAGKFRDSIAAARAALTLRPNYAEAWNNIAAGYNALSDWDNGIAAGEQAVRLKPDFELARNNLALARSQKDRAARSK
jgi:tetratricopeptide (TPR) repeat protein